VATELRLFADYFQIHVFDDGSEPDFGDLWTSQTVRDGLAVVMGWTECEPDAARFEVTPGRLGLRSSRSNLDTAGALDIDSAKTPETMERARIQVWPTAPADVTVVKRWDAAQGPAAP
jgi:hypothetical protein